MRELLATTFTGIVVDENEQFYFVQKNGITFRLKKRRRYACHRRGCRRLWLFKSKTRASTDNYNSYCAHW